MWLQTRHRMILSLLASRQQVTTDTLADELDVSRETIRRDLVALEMEGHVKRVHGGAVLPQPLPEEPFQERMALHRAEKAAIAKLAASLIEPGQCVLVDAGTTTSVFARELAKVPDISVITNSFDIAATLHRADSDVEVLLLGGRIHSDVPGTYGELTLSEIARFQADVTVLSPVALDPEKGAGSYDLHEAEVARAMIAQGAKLMMLADHSKLGVSSRVQYCTCQQIDTLVTSAGAPKAALEGLKACGVARVVPAAPNGVTKRALALG